MKQKTKELIKYYQKAFHQGKTLKYYDYDKNDGYSIKTITNISQIKELVVRNVCIRIW